MATGETQGLEQIITQLPSYFSSEEVHQQTLKVSVLLKQERETRQAAFVTEINAALKRASDAVRTAKAPEELDEPIRNLSRLRTLGNTADRVSEDGRAAVNKIEPALSFLKHWQEYIFARKGDNVERTRQVLRELINYDAADLIPRSQLLAELQKYPTEQDAKPVAPRLEQIDEIVGKVKTLDALPSAIKELRSIKSRTRGFSGTDPVAATLNTLVSIDRTYQEFRAGLPTKLEGPATQSQDLTSAAVTQLKVQLLLLTLPRYLNVPPDLNPKPAETVQAYLQRIIDESRVRSDGGLLTRAREAQRFLSGSYQTPSEPQAMTLIAAAKNQETAGQFALAVASYQNALKTGGDTAPAKLVGERLTELKAAHPREYDEGMKLFLTPPARAEYGPMFMRGPIGPGQETPVNTLPVPAPGSSAMPAGARPALTTSPPPTPH